MADAHLTTKQQKDLTNGFAKVEEEIVGHSKHEEFHRLLDSLKKKYLT